MHQPWYIELGGGKPILPWVRLHALKEYLDIPAVAAEFPRLVQTFNWVPALLDQVERAAAGHGDPHLDVARRPASELDSDERRFLVREFFSIGDREIAAIPGWKRLYDRVLALEKECKGAAAEKLSDDDLRDLQLFFHLGWSGELLRGRPKVAALLRRKKHFSEEDKALLLDAQQEFLGTVLPGIRELASAGAIASSTSPYHHPILPLLIEPATAFRADPKAPHPDGMEPRPGDALAHLRLGRETFRRHFGFVPNGLWPPEGAVGPATVRLLGDEGVVWLATDEGILRRSLPPSRVWDEGDEGSRVRAITRPWRLEGRGPALFFRDRELSDRIGFVYARWDADEAAADFVERIRRRSAPAGEGPACLTIALDGENAWEHFDRSGRPFLRALFSRLSRSRDLRVVGFEEALAEVPAEELPALHCGSWIESNLRTWMGDEEKNRAWALLHAAVRRIGPELLAEPPRDLPGLVDSPPVGVDAGACRAALLAAEASDWFWWFGEGHTSSHDADFDRLFRAHLRAACRFAGRPPLVELEEPIRKERPATAARKMPTGRLSRVVLDGRATDYWEWLPAGRIGTDSEGSMHRGTARLRALLFGTDGRSLYLRLDPFDPPASERLADVSIRVDTNIPCERSWTLPLQKSDPDPSLPAAVAGRLVEIRLPLADCPLAATDPIAFRLELFDEKGRSIERVPSEGWMEFAAGVAEWSV
jgi:alpha-amylase/alpha-mannosidase (GH57 family)